jgi:hypothetical protein
MKSKYRYVEERKEGRKTPHWANQQRRGKNNRAREKRLFG